MTHQRAQFHVVLTHAASPDRPRLGLRPDDVVCRVTDAGTEGGWQTLPLTPFAFRELGHGVYALALEWTADLPADGGVVLAPRDGLDQPFLPRWHRVVEPPQALKSPAPTTTTIYGRLFTIENKPMVKSAVTAKPAPAPQFCRDGALGLAPVATHTDEDGRFTLALVTGLSVQIQIPDIRYDRVILVPPAPAHGIPVPLFSL